MYGYIKGIVTEIEYNYIVIDNNDIGYLIYVPNPFSYSLDSMCKVYTYNYIREDEISLFGFISKEEMNLFLKLIDVKGIGPRMCLPILASGDYSNIVLAIEKEDINYLKKFPKIGEKLAKQIVLDLKGKLVSKNETSLVKNFDELVMALEGLGYKKQEIIKITDKIDGEKPLETQIKEALKLLLK